MIRDELTALFTGTYFYLTHQHTRTININQAQNVDQLFRNLVESPGPVYSRLQPVSDVTMFAFEGRWEIVRRYFEAKLEGMAARR